MSALAKVESLQAHYSFRSRLLEGKRLIGTFLKTPTGHATEILGALDFDFVCIDQEHGPFDRTTTDGALLAARASNIAALVRVPDQSAILSVLDCGATGVLVPHVSSVAQAKEVAALCRYRGGRRGFAASTRAGAYGGAPMWEHIEESDKAVTVVAQIEDPEALDHIDAIAAIPGIDALFIGRGDLTAAYGDPSPEPPEVVRAVELISAAARRANKPVAVFVGSVKEAKWLASLGATMFVNGSDHVYLKQAAAQAAKDLREA